MSLTAKMIEIIFCISAQAKMSLLSTQENKEYLYKT